eukprot:4074259-Alexandrium_andersonii.AAC.1
MHEIYYDCGPLEQGETRFFPDTEYFQMARDVRGAVGSGLVLPADDIVSQRVFCVPPPTPLRGEGVRGQTGEEAQQRLHLSLLERCPISDDEEFTKLAACVPPCGEEVMYCFPCPDSRAAADIGRGHSLLAAMLVQASEMPGWSLAALCRGDVMDHEQRHKACQRFRILTHY